MALDGPNGLSKASEDWTCRCLLPPRSYKRTQNLALGRLTPFFFSSELEMGVSTSV